MSKARVAGFGLSVDGFSAGIERCLDNLSLAALLNRNLEGSRLYSARCRRKSIFGSCGRGKSARKARPGSVPASGDGRESFEPRLCRLQG